MPGNSHTLPGFAGLPWGPALCWFWLQQGSWLPVHGNPWQLGQTGTPPQAQVHLITDAGQPQGHPVSARRHRAVWYGYAGEDRPPTQPSSYRTRSPEREAQWDTGASSKHSWCPSHPRVHFGVQAISNVPLQDRPQAAETLNGRGTNRDLSQPVPCEVRHCEQCWEVKDSSLQETFSTQMFP